MTQTLNIFGIDVVVTDGIPQDTMMLLPRFQASVPRPPGLSDLEFDALCVEVLANEIIEKAKQGQVGIITGIK